MIVSKLLGIMVQIEAYLYTSTQLLCNILCVNFVAERRHGLAIVRLSAGGGQQFQVIDFF